MAKKAPKKKTAAQKARTKEGYALVCGFCGRKGFKGPQGLASHKRRCKEAPEEDLSPKAGGRPTEYSPELVLRVYKYLESCEDKWYPQIQSYKEGEQDGPMEKLNVKQQLHVKIPSVRGFSLYSKIPKSTIYDWAKKHPEFSDALELISDEQHERLFNQGLAGVYNPTIAKLGLTSNHGYSDKKGVVADVGPTLEEIINSDDEEVD